jgi:hypothetical protein
MRELREVPGLAAVPPFPKMLARSVTSVLRSFAASN